MLKQLIAGLVCVAGMAFIAPATVASEINILVFLGMFSLMAVIIDLGAYGGGVFHSKK